MKRQIISTTLFEAEDNDNEMMEELKAKFEEMKREYPLAWISDAYQIVIQREFER